MKTKIMCGCGLYSADTLDEYDKHLAEVAAEGDDIEYHTKRTSAVTMYEDPDLINYTQADLSRDLYYGMGR